jgi:hypothetical protein
MLEQSAPVVIAVLEVSHEGGQQRLAAADPVVDPFFGASLVDGEPAQCVVGNRAGCDPRCPLLRFFDRPAVQVSASV